MHLLKVRLPHHVLLFESMLLKLFFRLLFLLLLKQLPLLQPALLFNFSLLLHSAALVGEAAAALFAAAKVGEAREAVGEASRRCTVHQIREHRLCSRWMNKYGKRQNTERHKVSKLRSQKL